MKVPTQKSFLAIKLEISHYPILLNYFFLDFHQLGKCAYKTYINYVSRNTQKYQ